MTSILIAGIGGVGGYFGGRLAYHFASGNEAHIYFLARGQHLQVIQQDGLTLISHGATIPAYPFQATDNTADIGPVDYILICTKSYDLEQTIRQLAPCIHKDTILLPLLNGVDSYERIKQMLPDNIILQGCVYIVSRLTAPGRVENSGNIEKLYLGPYQAAPETLSHLNTLCQQAGIDTTLTDNITMVTWEKFIFIATVAAATTYYDATIGVLCADETCRQTLIRLIEEVVRLALARKIPLQEEITSITLNKIRALPYGATSSMHTDFQHKRKKTELESLVGYVVHSSSALGIYPQQFGQIYKALLNRLNSFN